VAALIAPLEDAAVDQVLEARGQHVAGDAQPALPLVEPGDPQERVADDQQRPPLAHHVEGAGDRARHLGERRPAHSPRLSVASRN
jgi:hypothetical protein